MSPKAPFTDTAGTGNEIGALPTSLPNRVYLIVAAAVVVTIRVGLIFLAAEETSCLV